VIWWTDFVVTLDEIVPGGCRGAVVGKLPSMEEVVRCPLNSRGRAANEAHVRHTRCYPR
jgi:hypothetical protein